MVVGDHQAHIRSKVVVTVPVFARAGNDQIAAQTQQRFKHHHKGHLAAALHLPVGNQGLIVDEPASVPYPCRLALIGEILRYGHAVGQAEFLVIPEPEGLHPQKAAAEFKQAVHKPQRVSGGEQKRIVVNLQAEAFREKIAVFGKADGIAGGVGFGKHGLHIPVQGGDGILNRFCRFTGNDRTVAVENHKSTSLLKKGLVRKANGLALSVKACRLCQLPQSGSLWQSTQASSLCQGLSLWERWICAAKTERASTLKKRSSPL